MRTSVACTAFEGIVSSRCLDPRPFIRRKICCDLSNGAGWQVPEQIFITDKLPKGATGKIQRRHMPAAFLGKDKAPAKGSQGSTGSKGGGAQEEAPAKDSGKPLHRSKL